MHLFLIAMHLLLAVFRVYFKKEKTYKVTDGAGLFRRRHAASGRSGGPRRVWRLESDANLLVFG